MGWLIKFVLGNHEDHLDLSNLVKAGWWSMSISLGVGRQRQMTPSQPAQSVGSSFGMRAGFKNITWRMT